MVFSLCQNYQCSDVESIMIQCSQGLSLRNPKNERAAVLTCGLEVTYANRLMERERPSHILSKTKTAAPASCILSQVWFLDKQSVPL